MTLCPQIGALVAALVLAPTLAQAAIKVVAQQNDPSPLAGFTYQRFGDLDISDAPGERVVVYGRLRGRQCLFRIDPDNDPDSTVACQRGVTPDQRALRRIGPPSINATSAVAFAARVSQGRSGVYRDGISIVALFGDTAPCVGAAPILEQLAYGRITDSGAVGFTATMTGCTVPEVNDGVFMCSGGNGNCSTQAIFGGTGVRTTIALAGDMVPDRPGRFFCDFHELDASDYGVVFRASTKLDCANNAEIEATGVFRRTFPALGLIQTIALQGEAGNPPATTLGVPTLAPAISNTGMVAFAAGATTGSLTTAYLYLCDPATCPLAPAEPAASLGQADDDGNVFKTFSAPGVSDSGDVGFSARVRGATRINDGLFRAIRIPAMPFDIQKIAVSDDPVPGTVPTAFFRALPGPSAMSPSGRVVSRATIVRSVTPRRTNNVIVDE